MLPEFTSTTMLDYSRSENEAGMSAALQTVRSGFGATYPLVIDGKRIQTPETFQSANPANASECVGNFAKGTVEHVGQAVEAALKAFESWRWTPHEERGNVLLGGRFHRCLVIVHRKSFYQVRLKRLPENIYL